MDLRIGQVRNERSDQQSRLSLSDERRSSCDDGFSTRDLHGVEEDGSELLDEPLQDTPVVEKLDEGDEEDDGWENIDDEVPGAEDLVVEQECSSLCGESKEGLGKVCDEIENVILFHVNI